MTDDGNSQKKKRSRRVIVRRSLMLGGILAVISVAGWFYLNSGRFIATDDAYVKAAKILITPQVAGTIVSVSITDNQPVHAGEVLFKIDPASYRISLEKAKADTASAYQQIEQLKAQYRQKREDLAQAQVEANYASGEYDRRIPLIKKGTVSQSDFSQVKSRRDAAIKAVAALREEISGLVAALANNPNIRPEDHPLYRKALAAQHEAELNLKRTVVTAPANGIIGSAPHKGDYARAGVPLLNLVDMDDVWIEANYKETELTNVKVGQPVTVEIDTYPGHKWQGRVQSISPATGAEFSVLPAQNATGNWVKVVQRIAVRIIVDPGPDGMLLRTGMSTHVTIDTGRYPHALKLWG